MRPGLCRVRAPPLAGSCAGWARWRVEGCGGRAREAAVLFFLAGGGRPQVAPPRAPRPTAASAPRARPAACCCGCSEALSGAGAVCGAGCTVQTPPPSSAPLPAGRAPASPPPPPPPGFPPTARARRASRFPGRAPCGSLSLDLLQFAPPFPRPSRSSTQPDWPWRNLAAWPHSWAPLALDSAHSLSARGQILGLLYLLKNHTLALGCRPPGPSHFAWAGVRASSS